MFGTFIGKVQIGVRVVSERCQSGTGLVYDTNMPLPVVDAMDA
ncbi:hypothetical protein SAMN05660429_00044 [Thalassotalea agarivorans]|uniref:Uncharacterized protein n=1 Tax=Thalassotalea agarivorans TaxID=349064 RepID=A0A1H9Y2K9_THASX|nr:hypothetical protein SAMN05660429_00044 [Thalassotalea agarivorans]